MQSKNFLSLYLVSEEDIEMKKKTVIQLSILKEGRYGEDYLRKEIEGELLYCPKGTPIFLAEGWACEEVKDYYISITKDEIVAYICIVAYYSSEVEESSISDYKNALMKEGFELIE